MLVLALLAGAVTFAAVFRYVGLVNSQVGPMAQAVITTRQVDAWTPLESGSLTTTEIPQRWLPPGAVQDVDDVVGLVVPASLPVGSLVQNGMVTTPPPLPEDERTFAITVDRESGVAGQLQPESVVDVIAAYESTDTAPAEARAIVVNARVLSVGRLGTGAPPPPPEEGDGGAGGTELPDSQTVTLALTSSEALDVSFAQSFSERVRLVQVPDGSTSELQPGDRVTGRPENAPPPPAEGTPPEGVQP